MKNLSKLWGWGLLVLVISFTTSCQKEITITEEDAADMIETALQGNTAGLTATIQDYAENLVTDFSINDICDSLYNSSFNFSYDSLNINTSYTINWSYNMTCNSFNLPQTANLTATKNGSISTRKLNSSNNSTTTIAVTGLELSASNLSFNGSYNRSGSTVLVTNRATRSLASTINLNLANIIVDKRNFEIQSGSTTVTISAVTDSDTFNFSGTVVFNGNNKATLTINGNNYPIVLK